MLPLTLWDLSLWITFVTIILLVTAELVSPRYGQRNLLIDKKKLNRVALAMSVLFVAMVAIRVYEILL